MIADAPSLLAADEDEPALIAAGPPAITRRMLALWRGDPELQGRFDISALSGRRAYLVWFARDAGHRGVGDASQAAAETIMRRGISLSRPTPAWSPQSCQIASSQEALDAWLAAPIDVACDDGSIIPLPRCLALLWELRQDARMHFRNNSRKSIEAFIAWCLTQGIGDGCVAVDLVEVTLADFLDEMAEGPSHIDAPPLTRMLRLMAPLYGGPFADLARRFPDTSGSRLAVALWVYGTMRQRFRWPLSFLRRVSDWFSSPSPGFGDAFVSIDNLLYALWRLVPDLRQHDIHRHEGRASLRDWFDRQGAREFSFADFPGVQPCSKTKTPPSSPLSRSVCLTGYAGLVSGRAEDLRMTAVALRRHGQACTVLDRVSGAFVGDTGGKLPPPAVNIVLLNADTAFFDHLFLRERGLTGAYTVGYWAWELGRFPEEWLCAFSFVDEVWTASRFSYEAIRAAATKPVFLMPLAVDVPRPIPTLGREHFGLPGDDFVILTSSDFRSFVTRKNPMSAITAFHRAFPNRSEKATLVIKTIGSAWRSDDRQMLVDAIGNDTRIRMIDLELDHAENAALMALSDCFLSLHRSEGFGRGPAEAMMLGKAVIATDYSGTQDFISDDSAILVDYRLMSVGLDEYPGAAGQVWADPDIDQASAGLRRLARDPDLRQRLGKAGRARIQELCDPAVAGARYLNRLAAIFESSEIL